MRIIPILCGIGALLLCSCSKEPSPANTETTAESGTSSYVLVLKSVVPDENHKAMGRFHFRHSQPKAISLHGFGFEDERGNRTENSHVFRVRFETFKRRELRKWIDVLVGYCGTGAQEYPLEPNQDYTFLIPLWPFVEQGTHGIVGLSGTGTTIESEPFEISEIKKIASSK